LEQKVLFAFSDLFCETGHDPLSRRNPEFSHCAARAITHPGE